MGSCIGKDGHDHKIHGLRNSTPKGQFDLAITDPDLGWRRRNRHTDTSSCYPRAWCIEGIRPQSGEEVTTDMIKLSIAAGYHACQIWNQYTAIGRLDNNIDVSNTLKNQPDIHRYFGLMKLEWKLLERCRPFRCSEVNPCGIQGAATLAKIETVDNKGAVDVKDRQTTASCRVEDLVTQGSSWKEGDLVQVMVHKIDANNNQLGPIKRKHFFIDSAEIALNIVEFERRIGRSKGTFDELIKQATRDWVTDQDVVKREERVQTLLNARTEDEAQDDGRSVIVISPKGEVFEFVPEDLLLSVTSRLQEAFMTQSAF